MVDFTHNHSSSKKGKSDFVIATCIVVALMAIIIWYVYVINPNLWIITIAFIIEIALAFASYSIRRYSKSISMLLIIFSMFVPLILAAYVSFLRPILILPFVFLAAFVAISTFLKHRRRFRNKTDPKKLPSTFPFNAVFPADLPLGLEEEDQHIHKKKHQTTLELYYQNNGAWLWIYESNGVITREAVKLPTQKSEKIINGIPVNIAQEIPKKPSSRKRPKIRPPYVEATWSTKGINFNVRTDWISIEDVEKILASMIK